MSNFNHLTDVLLTVKQIRELADLTASAGTAERVGITQSRDDLHIAVIGGPLTQTHIIPGVQA